MKITLTFIGALTTASLFSQAKIEALETIHNFDTLHQYDPVIHDFKFVNTGTEPLIISHAKTSCGCDVPSWKKEPIMPGDTLVVNYKYDSKRIGPINKSMTITTNATNNPQLVVRSKGYILPKKEVIK